MARGRERGAGSRTRRGPTVRALAAAPLSCPRQIVRSAPPADGANPKPRRPSQNTAPTGEPPRRRATFSQPRHVHRSAPPADDAERRTRRGAENTARPTEHSAQRACATFSQPRHVLRSAPPADGADPRIRRRPEKAARATRRALPERRARPRRARARRPAPRRCAAAAGPGGCPVRFAGAGHRTVGSPHRPYRTAPVPRAEAGPRLWWLRPAAPAPPLRRCPLRRCPLRRCPLRRCPPTESHPTVSCRRRPRTRPGGFGTRSFAPARLVLRGFIDRSPADHRLVDAGLASTPDPSTPDSPTAGPVT